MDEKTTRKLITEVVALGSSRFWQFYDEMISIEGLTGLVKEEQTPVNTFLQEVMRHAHPSMVRFNYGATRPEKGWSGEPRAWLALRGEQVINEAGHVVMYIQPGDVMTREFGWDRDVFVTQAPIHEHVMGYFLNQGWINAEKGLFLPLFSKTTILQAIRIKLERNHAEALAKAEEESSDWNWPE